MLIIALGGEGVTSQMIDVTEIVPPQQVLRARETVIDGRPGIAVTFTIDGSYSEDGKSTGVVARGGSIYIREDRQWVYVDHVDPKVDFAHTVHVIPYSPQYIVQIREGSELHLYPLTFSSDTFPPQKFLKGTPVTLKFNASHDDPPGHYFLLPNEFELTGWSCTKDGVFLAEHRCRHNQARHMPKLIIDQAIRQDEPVSVHSVTFMAENKVSIEAETFLEGKEDLLALFNGSKFRLSAYEWLTRRFAEELKHYLSL